MRSRSYFMIHSLLVIMFVGGLLGMAGRGMASAGRATYRRVLLPVKHALVGHAGRKG